MKFLRQKEGVWFLLAVLALWTAASCGPAWHSQYLFPSPRAVLLALWETRGELWRGTLASLGTLLPAYLAAAGCAIAMGVTAGCTPWVQRLFRPFSRFASPIPPNVYIPYAIALLPTFGLAAGFIIFIAAFWPIFLNSTEGAATLPARYRYNAASIGIGRGEFIWRIALVAALPHIFSGLSVSLVLSFIMLTVAELFGASVGLGRFVQFYADYSDFPKMVAGILYTGLVVLLVTEGLEQLRRRLLFWTRGA